jgi:ankyrin repeat protein
MINPTNIWKDNPILFNSLLRDSYDKFVEKLFNYSSLINITNIKNESLLHYSCFYGMIDKYYALINMGAEVQETIEKNNLLHYASLSGNDDFLIVELIKLGISPVDENLQGQTSLHFASNERICHYLNLWCLRNNINITHLQDKMKNTVAHYSCSIRNKGSTHYWVKNYEELKTIKNLDNLLFNEVAKHDYPEFCPLK